MYADRKRAQICRNCGRRHNMNDRCPAKDSKCRSCGRDNHWESVSRQKRARVLMSNGISQPTDRRRRKSRDMTSYRTHEDQGRGVNSISLATGQLTENFETMAFDNVKVCADNRYIELKDRPDIPATLKAKVDTGAQCNVLSAQANVPFGHYCRWTAKARQVGEH